MQEYIRTYDPEKRVEASITYAASAKNIDETYWQGSTLLIILPWVAYICLPFPDREAGVTHNHDVSSMCKHSPSMSISKKLYIFPHGVCFAGSVPVILRIPVSCCYPAHTSPSELLSLMAFGHRSSPVPSSRLCYLECKAVATAKYICMYLLRASWEA